MRVLFVVKELKMEPLGIMYLSAALKAAGHETDLARCDFGRTPKEQYWEFSPRFVCYSVCSGSEQFYLNLDQQLGEFDTDMNPGPEPRFHSVFGGPAVTFAPKRFKSQEGRSGYYRRDLQVRGEGEVGLVDIVEGREPKQLCLVDVNRIPDADRGIVYQFKDLRENPIKNIISRRGCKYSCSYCFNRNWNRLHRSQLPKSVIRYRAVDSVVREGRLIKEKWPVKLINFVDDDFTSSLGWLQEFAPKWKAQVGLPFFCSVRPESATEEAIKLIQYGGGEIVNMAIESANDENRRKVLTRAGSREAVVKAVDLVRKYGMRSRLQNIVGLPIEDPLSDAFETLDFNIKCNPTSSWCAILQAYVGTHVYSIAKKKGYAPEDGSVDEGFFGLSTLKIRQRRLIERLHKLWPVITRFPFLRKIASVLIRIPLPFSWYGRFFRVTKKYLCERDLWKVFSKL